mmetsp:Transcript_97682/g.273339  ORF Transcript_97682/g.273339 Transcript_97682/m.273339 type:complete len:339 (-) Transcript_97682:115-1131(-)
MKPQSEMDPLLKDLGKRRSIFVPGQRMRMNVVPMFLNVFLPWGVFVFCCGITSFWIMYAHVGIAWGLVGSVFAIWFFLCGTALWARRYEPDPTWFTYTAIMVGIMAILGTIAGRGNFKDFSERYYQVADLKVVHGIDASFTPGTNVMDAGIFRFAAGNKLDGMKSWHFKFRDLYCVAPIITNGTAPTSQRYDFWAVGKECCSVAASDFRCGAWGDKLASGGIRLTDAGSGGDLKYYRLAVQQAESLYNIMAPNPIFLTWSSNPRLEVESWRQQVFKNFLVMVVFALVFSFFCMTLATCGYAFLGRSKSAYGMDILSEKDWQQGGYSKPAEFSTRPYQT